MTPLPYGVQLIRDEAALCALEGDWTRLLRRAPQSTVFASFEWNWTWWQYFGAGNGLYVLAVGDDKNGLAGIAPLMCHGVGPLRKLEFIGTGLSDCGDFVLRPDCAADATAAIFAWLTAHRHDWDLLDLDEIPPYSPVLCAVRTRPPPGLRTTWLARSDNPFIALPPSWEDYRRGLPRRHRAVFERRLRRFGEQDAAAVAVVREGAAVGPAVAALYRLHLARWAGRADALEAIHLAPNFGAFLQKVCTRLAARGWLRLLELRTGDALVATSLSFLVNGHWNGYLKGFDPAWAGTGPGQVLDALTIRQACDEQAAEFDFGRGGEEYKYRFGAAKRTNWRLVLTSRTPRSTTGLILTHLRSGGRALRQALRAARDEMLSFEF